MGRTFTIGQLARQTAVPASTLRYYERIGLLRPGGRTAANYRVYGEEAVEQVRFIRSAQASGFLLEDIATLLEVHEGESAPCGEVRELIEQRLAGVKEKLRDMRRLRSVMEASLARCREADPEAPCEVVDELHRG